jgi:coenzyme F420-dependent glucose-6-phosphate dehydrogenase
MLRLGWKATPEQFPPGELLDYAIAADEAGFDLIDASDHFHPWSEAGQASFVWTWLGAAAARTERIVLGPGVTSPILRYHPAIIAQASATLAAMAPGRTYQGVGTGEALNDYAASGEWPEYRERQDRLREALDLIRLLWSGEVVTYDGRYYRTRKARLYTLPPEPIPIYISSLVPGSASFAGRYGEGLVTTGGKRPELYREILGNFGAGAREVGKDPARMPRLIEINVAYTEDRRAALEAQRKYWAGASVPAMYNQKIYTPAMSEQNGEAVGTDTLDKKTCISADPADHVAFTQRYVDLGFTHIVFHSAQEDQRRFIEAYGREVLPRIRERVAAVAMP